MSTERTREIDKAASAWLIRRDSGHWTPVDQERFDDWLNASSLHQVAFLRLELAWEDSARLKALGAGNDTTAPPALEQWNLTPFFDSPPGGAGEESLPAQSEIARASGSTGESKRAGARPFFLTAAVVLLTAAGFVWHFYPEGDRYTTSIGSITTVPIADGSRVTLNTDSQLRILLTGKERGLYLARGEAYFEVARDPKRPFVVYVGNRQVIALGTKFSVRRGAADTEVIVTEGAVRLNDDHEQTPDIRETNLHANSSSVTETELTQASDVVLTPGEIAIAQAGKPDILVQRMALPVAEEQLSWRHGILTFRNQTLARAAAEFNRYNTRKIVIKDAEIGQLKLEGNFSATNLDAFIRLLESGFPVKADQTHDTVVLESR